MTANKYNPDSTGSVRFNFNQTIKGEVKNLSFSAKVISEKDMTLAAQMRLSQSLLDRDMLEVTASRIAGRLRGVVIDGEPQKLNRDRVLAWLESEEAETQTFVVELVNKFGEAVGVVATGGDDSEEHLEKN